MQSIKCTICHDPADPETDPDVIYERSPLTFRKGWMHGWCARTATEDLTPERKDAYFQKD